MKLSFSEKTKCGNSYNFEFYNKTFKTPDRFGIKDKTLNRSARLKLITLQFPKIIHNLFG